MYEANPLSMIVENAGGKSSNGKKEFSKLFPKNYINALHFLSAVMMM